MPASHSPSVRRAIRSQRRARPRAVSSQSGCSGLRQRIARGASGCATCILRNVKHFAWSHERLYRIYRELELNLPITPRRRLVREVPQPLAVPAAINQVWSMDFVHDQLRDGRSVRLFIVLDEHHREGLGIDVELSLPSARVSRSLDRIIA